MSTTRHVLKCANPVLRLLLITMLLACAALFFHPAKSNAGHAARSAVVVELFTSEGCSSCPPADELLRRLPNEMAAKNVEVIPLGFHVDYWNSLGWKDRFSSAGFSRRQEQYARKLGVDGPYTPQMIVAGTVEFVGNDAGQARRAIAEAASSPASAEVAISLQPGDHLSVRVKGPAASEGAAVMLAVTEDNLATNVGAGENNGRELRHAAVVRELRQLGEIHGGSFEIAAPLAIEKEWKRGDLRSIIFVQQGAAGKILGAASVPLLAQTR